MRSSDLPFIVLKGRKGNRIVLYHKDINQQTKELIDMAYTTGPEGPIKDNEKPFAWRAAESFKHGERKKLVIARRTKDGKVETVVTNIKNAQKKGYTEMREPLPEELIFKRRE